MPHKRRTPVPESEMEKPAAPSDDAYFEFILPEKDGIMDDMRRAGHHTICQTLREIYHGTTDPAIRDRCRLAVAMAKAMTSKLHWYKAILEKKE